jgi:hypothetical protein
MVKTQKPAKKSAPSADFSSELGFVFMGGYPVVTG